MGGREFDSDRTNTQGFKITEEKVLPSANGETFKSSRITTISRRSRLTTLNNCGTLKNPHTCRKEKGMKFPVLWSGITRSVLGAPVNITCYIKKIVNCAMKQSGKVPHKVCKAHLIIPHRKYAI